MDEIYCQAERGLQPSVYENVTAVRLFFPQEHFIIQLTGSALAERNGRMHAWKAWGVSSETFARPGDVLRMKWPSI